MTTARFSRTPIGTKVAMAVLLAVGILFSAFLILTNRENRQQAEDDAVASVTEKSQLLKSTVEVLDRSLRSQVSTYMKVLQETVPGQFLLDQEHKVTVGDKPVSSLMLDGKLMNMNFEIPDHFTAQTGAYATIFVREGSNFVRITTSHKKEDGKRAIGTSLDLSHPAYQRLLNGQVYAGSASLFGGQYMTHYSPIFDTNKQVVGALYVGINFTESVRLLGEGIKTLKLGQEGGFYVLSARPGKDLGNVLIHRQYEGANLLEAKDDAGQPFIQTMLKVANGQIHYVEAGKDGQPARARIAAFSTVPDWQMLIVGDAYLEEITAGATRQRNQAALMGVVLLIVLTALLNFIIRRLVSRPFQNALEAVETVGSGNLTRRIEARTEDESGRLLISLQKMTDRLATVVTEVRSGTHAIEDLSAEVASGNLELSARTEQQAAALEQTASSMEEMNASVRHNAENAINAQTLSRQASNTAREGGIAVEQVVAKMDAITASSKRIADITGVVDSIAFQTNILALNAAVEAARAGEHGRGFAVVATEVRTLAQRSSAAAKEIKDLINQSLEQVSSGALLAQRAGLTMGDVVGAIVKATETIDEISAATQEQATGIDQINQAVAQLDQVTQKNAALVEEAAAAAQTMKEQAKRLSEVVEFFTVTQTSETVKSISKQPPKRIMLPA